MVRFLTYLLASVATVLIVGCSPYVEDFHYAPHPVVLEIHEATTQPAQQVSQQTPPSVVAYATVIGIRREDRQQHIPLSFEVRLQLDNFGAQPVSFDPGTLELTTADLVRFLPPIVTPPRVISVVPGQPAIVDANFPFPAGLSYDNTNLRSLQLHWMVQIDGHMVPEVADFRRTYRYYDDQYWGYGPYAYPYPYPYYGPRFGFGGVVVIRR